MTDTTLPVAPGSKDFDDLRDRAAYVHVTGVMPTHLREYMTDLLTKISRVARANNGNAIQIAQRNAAMLGLDDHPMVKAVREFVNEGYTIMLSRDLKARRPYGKVYLWKDLGGGALSRVVVQSDGSVLSQW